MTVILDDGERVADLPSDPATAARVVRIDGYADLRGYAHPLPALRRIDGWAILRDYAHALPDGLIVGGALDLSGCTALTALPDGLTVRGWLDLTGCTGLTALPDGLSVGASIDLRGCTGLDHYCVGRDARGYAFYGIPMRDGPHVVAGCRNFTGAQALAHWGPGGESDRPDCLALAQKAIVLIERSKEVWT